MRVVLYSFVDLQPITILSLSDFAMQRLYSEGRLTMPVHPKNPPVAPCMGSIDAEDAVFKTVSIMAERLVIFGKSTLIVFAGDDESALLLEAAFLPGQQKEIKDIKLRSFCDGVHDALRQNGYLE